MPPSRVVSCALELQSQDIPRKQKNHRRGVICIQLITLLGLLTEGSVHFGTRPEVAIRTGIKMPQYERRRGAAKVF